MEKDRQKRSRNAKHGSLKDDDVFLGEPASSIATSQLSPAAQAFNPIPETFSYSF